MHMNLLILYTWIQNRSNGIKCRHFRVYFVEKIPTIAGKTHLESCSSLPIIQCEKGFGICQANDKSFCSIDF